MLSTVVFFDLDNTLMDTNSVFAKAHLLMLKEVEQETGLKAGGDMDRLRYVRDLDEILIREHQGDKGYPPQQLVHALALRLHGQEPEEAARLAAKDQGSALDNEFAQKTGMEFLDYAFKTGTPDLFKGTLGALDSLREHADTLVLITENKNEDRAKRVLDEYHIRPLFDALRMVGKKSSLTYFKLAVEFPAAPSHPQIMIGDQIDSDISYAKHAGFLTIHVPGGFVRKDSQQIIEHVLPDHRVKTLKDAANIVASVRAAALGVIPDNPSADMIEACTPKPFSAGKPKLS